MFGNLVPEGKMGPMSLSRLRTVQLEADKADKRARMVVFDASLGLSEIIKEPKDTLISGGEDSARSYVISQMIRAYGSDRAVIVLHCGNRLLENKLCASSFSASKGGAKRLPVDPLGELDANTSTAILKCYLEQRGYSGSDEREALDITTNTAYLFSENVSLRSIYEVSHVGLAKQLISLLGTSKISQDDLDEKLESLEVHNSGQKTVADCIKEISEALGVDKKVKSPSLLSIIKNKGVLCIDLGSMDATMQNLLSFLIGAISRISDTLHEKPLLVFDSVPFGSCKPYDDLVATTNILKIISDADLTSMISKAEDGGIFSSARHKVFLNHTGKAADKISEHLGEYSGLTVDVSFHESKGFWDIVPTKTAVVDIRKDEHKKRVKSDEVSRLDAYSAVVAASCSPEIVITRIGRVV